MDSCMSHTPHTLTHTHTHTSAHNFPPSLEAKPENWNLQRLSQLETHLQRLYPMLYRVRLNGGVDTEPGTTTTTALRAQLDLCLLELTHASMAIPMRRTWVPTRERSSSSSSHASSLASTNAAKSTADSLLQAMRPLGKDVE